jgi:predicted AAA+ superfamily ATPase
MEIKRNRYLQELIDREGNGMVKVITGMRRVGKSYLLLHIFLNYLFGKGINDDHIIIVSLDDIRNENLREPHALYNHIQGKIKDNDMYYVMLDEIQFVDRFEEVLNSLLHIGNVDVYVTGSNAKFLSKDIITEFRGRGDEVNIRPLCFNEYVSAYSGTREEALIDYARYGGLPQILERKTHQQKESFLINIFNETYIKDIKERNRISNDAELEELMNILSSSIGGLLNPSRIANTFKTVEKADIRQTTIKKYLDIVEDAFLVEKALRYNIKGRKYIGTPSKYYFTDIGLRNARIGFRQFEMTHIMENLIYNELRTRGLSVDVGQTETYSKENGTTVRHNLKVDFVCNQGSRRWYVQSALDISDPEKLAREKAPLLSIRDSFPKIIITNGSQVSYHTDEGITVLNIYDFLLNPESLNY